MNIDELVPQPLRAGALVPEFLQTGIPECPVLVFTGSRSCGKTRTLEYLASRMDQNEPYALLDCAVLPADTPELLTTLAFLLNYRCAAYGRLSFPRLWAGLIAMRLNLDQMDPGQARAGIRAEFERRHHVDELRELVADAAAVAVVFVPGMGQVPGAPRLTRKLTNLVMKGLLAGWPLERVALGEGEQWYGHQDRGLARPPVDALVDLSRRAARLNQGSNRRIVDELLWSAFLADLHASFDGKDGWNRNCALLLDNADTPAGRRFLDELSRARDVRRAAGRPDAPLTVIAASRGKLLDGVLAPDWEAVPLREASLADYGRRRDAGDTVPGWYPVLLPDLTRDEVRILVAKVGWIADERLSPVVYHFARGHPGATHAITVALRNSPNPADLTAVLEWAGGLEDEHTTAEERILRLLTSGVSEYVMDGLTKCAAARNQFDASRLAQNSGLLTIPGAAQNDIFARELWVRAGQDQSGETRPDIMVPALRQLLLRRLAGGPDDWIKVNTWLKAAAAESGDQAGELYYALALGEVEEVTRRSSKALSPRMTKGEVLTWLRTLQAVTDAPRADGKSNVADIPELVNWTDPERQPSVAATASLVASSWLLSNSLNAADRRELHHEVSGSLNALAPFCYAGGIVFHAEAERHNRLSGE